MANPSFSHSPFFPDWDRALAALDLPFQRKDSMAITIRWFFREGRRSSSISTGAPLYNPKNIDPQLLRELRLRRYSLKTEESYGSWVRRFERFVAPKSLSE